MRQFDLFLSRDFGLALWQHREALVADVVRGEPHELAEADSVAAPDSLDDGQALVTRDAIGESPDRVTSGPSQVFRREHETGGHFPGHEAAYQRHGPRPLLWVVGVEARQDEEGALSRFDAPGRRRLLSVLYDTSRYGELVEHDRGEGQSDHPLHARSKARSFLACTLRSSPTRRRRHGDRRSPPLGGGATLSHSMVAALT